MTALIKKDLSTLKKSLIFMGIISIAMIAYGIYRGQTVMIPLLCGLIPLIMAAISSGYDSSSQFEQMAFSMPITKRDYVLSKLFLAFVFGIFGAISMFILLKIHNQIPLESALFISAFSFIIIILFSAVQLPFILKYGAEKGRLILVITYFLIFSISSMFKDQLNHMMQYLQNYSVTALGIGIIIAGIVIIGIFIKISIGILKAKEY